ncbi:MAG: AraC family transcriptional regulator [Pigmentiphaga sp.]|uniref:AraC family transcriptional regulator n=1 Tax=Pigmentiphaga sp. TaxID=1977564 RepID=UPI0029BCADA2|nr:AraC family transcriptional regulator [Pigmentiphaga sp.]MDX3904773.1 AraC family transcriptional regulator [Pigmentiphaga sp.]
MSVLLDDIPDQWGPKLELPGGAATRTRTGPNEIFLRPPVHLALMLLTPQPGRQISLNSDSRMTGLAPSGALEIIPTGSDFSARWSVQKENVLVALDPQRFSTLAGLEFGRTDFELHPPRLGTLDARAFPLAQMLKEELERGESANRLCVDALLTLFSVHLLRHYSTLAKRGGSRPKGGLAPFTWRRVNDYIHSYIADDITIEQLASVARLSPSHFLRAFRQTCGQPPHQYILTVRTALAERLVTTTTLPLGEIARSAGFSSHSHMTAVMRRLRGATPTQLRRDALGKNGKDL